MKSVFKKEYALLLAVIIGLSAYLYVNDRDRINYQLPDLPTIETSAVDKITITMPESDPVVLEKQDNTWRIMPQGYPAAENTISAILNASTDLTLTALVSQTADYNRYTLTDEDALTVSLFDEDNTLLRKFFVGKKAGSSNHTFVRLADNPAVYHARGSLHNTFDKTPSDLRDKTVMAFARADVQTIEIKSDDQTLILEKKAVAMNEPGPTDPQLSDAEQTHESEEDPKTKWVTADNKEGDADAIDSLLNNLWSLSCKSFINDRKPEDFGTPVYSLTIKATKDHTLWLFAPEEGEDDHPAVSSRAMTPFLLSKGKAAQIMKDPGTLLTSEEEK